MYSGAVVASFWYALSELFSYDPVSILNREVAISEVLVIPLEAVGISGFYAHMDSVIFLAAILTIGLFAVILILRRR